jgi:hypothetical protein
VVHLTLRINVISHLLGQILYEDITNVESLLVVEREDEDGGRSSH